MRFAGEFAALGTALCWATGSNLFAAAGRRMGSVVLNRLRITVAAAFLCTALLVFRGRNPAAVKGMSMPGHPVTTLVFVLAFWTLAVSTILKFPKDAGMGVMILLLGVPVYLYWSKRAP